MKVFCSECIYIFKNKGIFKNKRCKKNPIYSENTAISRGGKILWYERCEVINENNNCKDFKYKRKKCKILDDVEFNIKKLIKIFKGEIT